MLGDQEQHKAHASLNDWQRWMVVVQGFFLLKVGHQEHHEHGDKPLESLVKRQEAKPEVPKIFQVTGV